MIDKEKVIEMVIDKETGDLTVEDEWLGKRTMKAEDGLVKKPKPRLRFCWVCSKQLRGNFYREVVYEKDGLPRIVHAACANLVNSESRLANLMSGAHDGC